MSVFSLQIISPEGSIWEGDAEAVTVCGVEGSLGVWANHAPMIAALMHGELTVRSAEESTFFAAGEGILEVRPDKRVVILIDYAEPFDTKEEAKLKAKELIDLL
jgi:F-type H+-transporting ATPase subunit epsilon